ncbi:hypothetical protein C8R43DRAFT_1130951 [Mycena crocata]|nr:hypothetical protein C8R43DRAFT_1130951 [Mycena crocata]
MSTTPTTASPAVLASAEIMAKSTDERSASLDSEAHEGGVDKESCAASANLAMTADLVSDLPCTDEDATATLDTTVTTVPAYPQKSVFFYITDPEEADEALRHIDFGHIGFDTEENQKKVDNTEDVQLVSTAVEPIIDADGVNWTTATLCIVQVAIPGYVYIFDVKRMQLIPQELRRIIGSSAIAKVGSGLINDGRVLHEEAGIAIMNLVEVGMMVKYADAERYGKEDAAGISLERCVKDVLGFKLDKSNRATFVWDGEEEADEKQRLFVDAGLDAQASLEVYDRVRVSLRHKELSLGRLIPDDWYTYDFIGGKATRMDLNWEGKKIPWAANLCPWYSRGSFQGYHYQ